MPKAKSNVHPIGNVATCARQYQIDYFVPHHPIVTWQDWLCAIHAMHKVEAMLMRSIETAATAKEIAAFKASLGD